MATKHIRDGIKSQYPKECNCAVCDTELDLEFHHYRTLSILLKDYSRQHNIPISTDEQVLAMRDKFYEDNWEAVVTDGVTLCNEHHKKLHKVYGREPAMSTAEKQKVWVLKQRQKVMDRESGTESQPTIDSGKFTKHIPRIRKSFASLL